jgi:hypothetical protein
MEMVAPVYVKELAGHKIASHSIFHLTSRQQLFNAPHAPRIDCMNALK